jgi:hypothetical protein
MITEHKLIRGTPEEIIQYIVSKPNYKPTDRFDIKKQIDKIGLEKQSMIFYRTI